MKVLIFGGEGYIGKEVKKYLTSKKHSVTSYDNLIYHDQNNTKNNNKNLLKFDLRDKTKVKQYIEKTDAVLILAGLVGDPITKKYPKYAKQINEDSLKFIIKYTFAKNIKKLIFISTCSNYGKIKNGLVADENYKLNPLSNYSVSKVKIENFILSFRSKKIKTTSTILRFATAFGHSNRMRFDLTVNQFVLEMYQKNKIEVYDKNTWRPYCHVKDFARLILLVLSSNRNIVNFEIFNAGGDENNYTKEMIAKNIRFYFPNGKVFFVKSDVDPRDYRVNFSKVKRVLKFKPKYSLNYGIKEIIKQIKSNKYNLSKKNFHGNYLIKDAKE